MFDFWATVRCRPAVGSFCLVPLAPLTGLHPGAGTSERALGTLRAAALDQGCLLVSTPSSTPITRARPHRHPIRSLGKSTFPRGSGGDWLRQLSVKWASRKDAAGVLGTRSPERGRSNLPHKQDVAPPIKREGWGAPKRNSALGPHRSGVGCAQSRGIPPSASRPPLLQL